MDVGLVKSVERSVFLLRLVFSDNGHIIILRQFLGNHRRHSLNTAKREDGVGQKADSFHFCVQKYG